ncbi:MAG TPA: hypothetical protein VGX96_09130 [Candidatus Elarobacter sp.]|jgi:hypothetical protein|nr:hypothetical protein [Candidatus Elarobacter sp.]
MKRFDVFLSDGHRLTTNEDGYRAIEHGLAASGRARLVTLRTARGERLVHTVEINVDQIVTISPVDDDA